MMGIVDLTGVHLWFESKTDDLTSSSSGVKVEARLAIKTLYLNNLASIQAEDSDKSI